MVETWRGQSGLCTIPPSCHLPRLEFLNPLPYSVQFFYLYQVISDNQVLLLTCYGKLFAGVPSKKMQK